MSIKSFAFAAALLSSLCGCATRSGSPQAKTPGTAALTGATTGVRFDRVLVAEPGAISMVARSGCVASVAHAKGETGEAEELRVRCPKPERIATWFAGIEKLTANIDVEPVTGENEDEITLPAVELITKKGDALHVKKRADTERLLAEVRALSAELASAEMPSPGPQSTNGWQMLRVSGPAHVYLGGNPITGVLDARVSTNGQYLCEFVGKKGIRASKSGWITPSVAAEAIDQVLVPFTEISEGGERRLATFAAATTEGSERRANAASTAAVFERFAPIQDALGDACLPELDAPPPVGL